jgi:hypothetical protein
MTDLRLSLEALDLNSKSAIQQVRTGLSSFVQDYEDPNNMQYESWNEHNFGGLTNLLAGLDPAETEDLVCLVLKVLLIHCEPVQPCFEQEAGICTRREQYYKGTSWVNLRVVQKGVIG